MKIFILCKSFGKFCSERPDELITASCDKPALEVILSQLEREEEIYDTIDDEFYEVMKRYNTLDIYKGRNHLEVKKIVVNQLIEKYGDIANEIFNLGRQGGYYDIKEVNFIGPIPNAS